MEVVSWSKKHGDALGERRRRRGFSQEALAAAAGVDPKTLRGLEQGKRQPRFGTLNAVAEALGCSYEDLLQHEALPAVGAGVTTAQLLWRQAAAGQSEVQPTEEVSADEEREAQATVDRPVLAELPEESGRVAERQRRRLPRAAVGLVVAMVAVGSVVAVQQLTRAPELEPNLVAVAIFDNATGDASFDHVGRHASEWIAHQISECGLAPWTRTTAVIADRGEMRSEGSTPPRGPRLREIAESLGAGIVIWGAYQLGNDSLDIVAEIHDVRTGELVYAVPQMSGSPDEPQAAIETLTETLLGALAAHYDLFVPSPRLAPPPSWAAYQELRATYWSPNPLGQDHQLRARVEEHVQHLERAAELDPRFLAAQFKLLNLHLFVLPDAARAKSCLIAINRHRGVMTQYESLMARAYGCMRDGDFPRALGLARQLREVAPRDQWVRLSTGVVAMLVNCPHEAVEMLGGMAPEAWCSSLGRTRFLWLCPAYHRVGEFEKELETARLDLFPDLSDIISPAAALGRIEEVERAVDRSLEAPQSDDPGDVRRTFSRAIGELRWHGYPEAAARLANRAVTYYATRPPDVATTWETRYNLARCLYLAERWQEAQVIIEQLAVERPESTVCRAFLGLLAARRGGQDEALAIFEELHRGEQFRWCASIAAVLGEQERAVELIREACARGASVAFVHADMDFESLRGYAAFEEFVRPKG